MKILVVEDEDRIASFIEKGLTAHGYEVELARTGRDGLKRGIEPDVSLVILDLKLPDLDGLQLLGELRGRGATVPVLILSALSRVEDRIRGLDLGADDYLVKPFAFEELLSRVRARLRRPGPAASVAVLRVGDISLDALRREVTLGARRVSLSAREFALLQALVSHPGQTLSRQELLSMAWGMDFDPHTNLVDVYIGYLRRKLGEPVIETIPRAGYRLQAGGRLGPPA